ncbi:MAG: hypothetical protein QM715_07310 [Nibricoccus sp.]
MKIRILFVALLALGTAFAAEPAPLQLKGVLNTGSEKLFGLSNETGDANAWVSLGKNFSGFTLKSYDEAKGLLLLERDGKKYELSLASAKIGAARSRQGHSGHHCGCLGRNRQDAFRRNAHPYDGGSEKSDGRQCEENGPANGRQCRSQGL